MRETVSTGRLPSSGWTSVIIKSGTRDSPKQKIYSNANV